MSRLTSQIAIRRAALLGALCVVAVMAVAVPSARSDNIGGDGGGYGTISCQASGNTSFGGNHIEYMGGCVSYLTGFSAYKAGAGTNCWAIGYTADIFYVDSNNNWVQRWHGGPFCLDGYWHFSSAWGYNERRVSAQHINSDYVDYYMIQYRR